MSTNTKSQVKAQKKSLKNVYEAKKRAVYYLCRGMTGSSELAESLTVQALEELQTSLAPEELPTEDALGQRYVRTALELCGDTEISTEESIAELPFWFGLETPQKELFVLRYLAELSNQELSTALDQPVRKVAGACTSLDNQLSLILDRDFGVDCGSRAAIPIHIRQRIVLEQNNQSFPESVDQAAAAILHAKAAQPAGSAQKPKKKWFLFGGIVIVCAAVLAGVLLNLPISSAATIRADYYAEITVENYGTITVALDAEAAPETVENFVTLAEEGFYDGLTFHRIIEGFMIQGGDPNGDGTGGSDATITGEFSDNGYENDLSHTRGAISMARSDNYDSASSQFFIVQEDSTYLDGSYACFGYVTDGMDIVDQICEDAEPTDDNGTIEAEEQPVITSITIYTADEYNATE